MSAKTIAITNQKGGVGKTTTTLNLAAGLVGCGKRVLTIDADPQASLTASLGLRGQTADNLDITLKDIMQAVINDEPIESSAAVFHFDSGIDLIPSNIELSGLETYLVNAISREYILKNALSEFTHKYDYILIDTMPSLGLMTINSLAAADSVIIPCQPSYLSAKGLDLLFKTVSRVKRQINPRLKIDGILMTMVDGRTNNAKAIIGSLRETVGARIKIFNTEIPNSVRAAESALAGRNIFEYDSCGKVADAYTKLTEEVMQIERESKNRSGIERI